MCLNRFDTDTKTAFLDLYTKVDADATAPAAFSVDDMVVNKNIETGYTIFRYKNETVAFNEQELAEMLNQGLTAEQVKARVFDTLVKIVAAKGVK
jgi:anaerobic ribonucleoside-triphosphate reductase